ncbi:TatD family hydrolase [Halobacteriovorax sp. GB3]|uniref:TatD family hydrolase n=1 Tax=Halobacteriovorax sp. GB3 TaxID=2719615 RepID=UPI002362015B|nr:TatD family hydrolase [Halobacteriovorax sp. GB3]MDD0851470.1 TatD family hydrolase [Halobacteriovorax sp. GB3]
MGKNKKREIPTWDLPIIETHCHLDYLKDLPTQEILEKSKKSNIEKVVTIAVEPGNLDAVIAISNQFDNVYCTQGIHPHEAKKIDQTVLDKIVANLALPKVVAVGEIGLDYHYDNSPRQEQREFFEKQLQIAVDHDYPVVIHTRDADEDTVAILKNFSSSLKRKGVIHSFTSGMDLAKFCLDEGFHLGFNGIITFNSAQNVRNILDITPLERILVETDAPFLTPVPYRGRENAPYYLPFVIEKIAEVKNETIEEVLKKTYKNAFDVFKF